MYLRKDFKEALDGQGSFEQVMSIQGEVYRDVAGRRTLRFVRQGKGYFLKIHSGVGWKEICKNLIQLRFPVLGAQNERLAIRRLKQLGLETMQIAGYGKKGWNPARQRSFIVTAELPETVNLEDFCGQWSRKPPSTPRELSLKRSLIHQVAGIARKMHENGINHRDLYLCHFLLDRRAVNIEPLSAVIKLYVIDLHRVQLRRYTPQRSVVKDIAGLFFSSMDIGLTSRDRLRFMRAYRGKPLRQILERDVRFRKKVYDKGIKLYHSVYGKHPETRAMTSTMSGKTFIAKSAR